MNGIMKTKGIVIFGGTGDLAYRKLFPSLFNLFSLNQLEDGFQIVGVGRRGFTNHQYRDIIKDWVIKFSRVAHTEEKVELFLDMIHYYEMDMNDINMYDGLGEFLRKSNLNTDSLIYYYAVSPQLFAPITDGLKLSNLTNDAKVMIEKPFGETLELAEKLYFNLKTCFSDENIFHIDHYLGKEMIINIMTLRFSNAVFYGIWNKDFIESVEINAYETLGVDSRGGYYDKSGALADMIQNHLFQIMSIVAMEKPVDFSSASIKASQSEVFKSLKKIDFRKIDESLVMGQYKGYLEEPKVSKDSKTETFVSMKLEIENDRWNGVPFILRTGKKLERRESEVVINFKAIDDREKGNTLVIKIQPDEGVKFDFNIKKPGTENSIQEVSMDFCQSCILENRMNTPEAYERLIKACMDSDKSLFSMWDHIELSWKYINEIVSAYKKYSNKLFIYEQGSLGPAESL